MQVQHVTELFSFEGEDFITEVFRNLLDREPDASGLRYYLGRLALGYDKSNVIAQIAKSSECRPHEELLGLQALLVEQQRSTHWFWGRWNRHSRTIKVWQSGIAHSGVIGQQLTAQQGVLRSLNQNFSSLSVKIADSLQQFSASSSIVGSTSLKARNLPDEAVRQIFLDVLGREPENDQVIALHTDISALRKALMTSEEFQRRVDLMPDYARLIFRRMLTQQLINSKA